MTNSKPAENEAPVAIRAQGLRKAFGNTVAVNGVDLAVAQGEIFGLVGPDGAGKTTTMRMLCGLLDADSGEVQVAGFDARKQSEKLKRSIGYMPQRFSLYGDLTVAENLKFFSSIYHVPRAQRRMKEQELLEFSRLTSFRNRLAAQLSGGMKQKLALACTLMHTPRVLFLDEPTTGVDPVSRRDFWRILYSLLHDNVTLFVSTPYMDEAERCNRIAFMNHGKILLCETPDELKKKMQGELIELIAEPQHEAMKVLKKLPQVLGAEVFGDRLHLWVQSVITDQAVIMTALSQHKIHVESVRQMAPGLEDVFISVVAGAEHEPR